MPTLEERRPGVWRIRVPNGRDPINGRRLTVSETIVGTKRDARQRLADIETAVRKANSDRRHRPLKAALTAWRAQSAHQSGTARNYDLGIATIPAHFLKTPIYKVDAEMIRELVKRTASEHGTHRARLVQAVVSGALTYAWSEDWIPDNPARKVRFPSVPRPRQTTPTAPEVNALLALCVDRPEWHAWLILSAMSGARRSEVLALRWSDVDLERGEIAITKALNPVGGGVKTTKTEHVRTVAIGPAVIASLLTWEDAFRARAAVLAVKPIVDPYVFTMQPDGSTPWRPDVATKRFAQLRNKAGIDCHLHSLRHYMATQALGAGVPLKTVADRLGHTRVATTGDLYGGAMPASDREAAAVMERGLTG